MSRLPPKNSNAGDSSLRERLARIPDPLALLEGMFAHSPVPYIVFDASGSELLHNRAYREMFGAEPPPGYNLFEDKEAERTGLAGFVRRAVRGETVQAPTVWYDPNEHRELGVREARRAAISCTFFPLMSAGGDVSHVAIAFKDVTAEWTAREEAEAERDERAAHLLRTAKLQEVTAAFSRALTPAEVTRISASAGIELLGASAGALSLLSPDGTELITVGSVGLGDDPAHQYSRIPLTAKLLPVDAVKTGQPIFCDSEADYLREYPAAARANTFQGGTRTSLPLCVEGRVIGAIGFAYDTWREIPREERELQQALAHLCAQVLERTRLYAEQRRAEERASFLARVGSAFMESLDYEATLTRITRLAVPAIADWCTVAALREGRTLSRIAGFHKDAEQQPLIEELVRRFPPTDHRDARYLSVFQQGRSILAEVVDDAVLMAGAQNEEHLRLLRGLGVSTCMMVPLISRGQPMGVISLMLSEPGRRYGPADLALAEELARRAAMAIENALLYQEAQEAIRARDTFLGIASHELNTPLTTLKLNLLGLERGLEPLPPGVLPEATRTRFQSLQRQVARLASLVRELLDVSRITAGRLKLEVGEVDLVDVTREVATRLAEDAARARCELRLDVPETVVGVWDPLRLDQVLQNLLSNALKYGQGEPVEVTVRADADSATVTVRDHGIGIAAEDQPRLFQKFERVASERHYSGFGLGLWIVKQILDAMGGSIQVESASGHGATFRVVLPRSAPP